eukprot:4693962-Heterocapsa_arctica.AAC.1
MRRYRETNHDIIFEDWWTCKNCKAKGPHFNKRKCIQFSAHTERTGTYDDDDGHDDEEDDEQVSSVDYGTDIHNKPDNKPKRSR